MNDPKHWCDRLGLLPVPLFDPSDTQGTPVRFVLLNGLRGSFCLALDGSTEFLEARNQAWSANVAHYVSIVEKTVRVQRWDKAPGATDSHDLRAVTADLEKFHSSLETEAPNQDRSVIAHSLRVFRSLRAALGDHIDGGQALSAFLLLIASELDRVNRSDLNLDKWHLSPQAAEISAVLHTDQWEALASELRNGRPLEHLQPIMTLVLRHAAGLLFQEAHYEALFAPYQQLNLRIFAPPPLTLSKQTTALGLHFTPAAIVRTVVEECITSMRDLPGVLFIFDPACGSGEFLREVLRQLSLRSYKGKVSLLGWDISTAACEMARFVLHWEASHSGVATHVDIQHADALSTDRSWPDGLDMVLMNPPFVSWGDMTQDQRAVVLACLDDLGKIRPDLSTAFVYKAASHLRTGGVLGTLLPASFLDGASFIHVREALGHRLAPSLIARLGSHQLFPGARVDPGLYIATRRPSPHDPPLVLWADHRARSTSAAMRSLRRLRSQKAGTVFPIEGDGFSIYPNPEIGSTSARWAPRPYRQWRVLSVVSNQPHVAERFSVMQGALSGLNAALLLSGDELHALPSRERAYFRPAVVNESIEEGALRQTTFIFYPYGEYAITSEDILRNRLPQFYKSLLPHKDALKARKGIDPLEWWLLTRRRAWQAQPVRKIVSTYFGDSGSFAWDEDGSFIVVQGYGWLQKGARQLSKRLWLAYLAVLNSPLFSDLLAATSNHVGGGQWNLSKRFVDRIPLPDLSTFDDHEIIDRLSRIGLGIHRGGRKGLLLSQLPTFNDLVDAVYERGGKV